jgi:methylmalonyl-CoA mutase cobalamin-binding subunit
MTRPSGQLREQLHRLSQEWMAQGLPSRQVLDHTAAGLRDWKQCHAVTGIWPQRPLMATATIDDGIGQGIEIISRYAEVAGLRIQPLGLMQTPESIVAHCRRYHPAILGLTILQLDSDEALARIGHQLPSDTALIAGGPVFKFDPQMARRCGVTYAAPNLACFINFLLNWTPDHDTAP